MAIYAVSPDYGAGLNPEGLPWLADFIWADFTSWVFLEPPTSSLIVLANEGGGGSTETRLEGSNFSFLHIGNDYIPIGGTVLSMERTNPGGSVVFERINDLSVPLLEFAAQGGGVPLFSYVLGGDETIVGSPNHVNYLWGGPGGDVLQGGSEFDFADYRGSPLPVWAALDDTSLNVNWAAGDSFTSIEGIIGSSLEDRLSGDHGANILRGEDGNDELLGRGGDDQLIGGLGSDVMQGGDGNDIYYVDSAFDQVIEAVGVGGGDDTVYTSVSYVLTAGSPIETLATTNAAGTTAINLDGNEFANALHGNAGDNKLYGGAGNDTLIGNLGNDVMQGGDGDDRLDGGAGADYMQGGGGNDHYYVDNLDFVAKEAVGGGTDSVSTSVSWTLEANSEVERIETNYWPGTGAINLTGNEFNQTLIGNAGVNVLNGLGGADFMQGNGGNDIYYVDNASDRAVEAAGGGTDRVLTSVSWTLEANSEVERIDTTNQAGTGAINLTGNEFNQTLIGNAGVNVLNGLGGADYMQGNGGNDRYYVDNALDRVIEGGGGGTDTIYTSVSYTLQAGYEIETLATTNSAGTTAINLTGNNFTNSLYGNAGNNGLNGFAGADFMQGNGGNDRYYVDNALDKVIEGGGGGVDTVNTSVSYTLGAGYEIETLATTNSAGTTAINLTGNNFANSLYGNAGNNVLNGGAGNDSLRGNGGNDTFLFNTALNAATNRDTIVDYNTTLDEFQLAKTVFTHLTGSPGQVLLDTEFFAGASAHDASDRVIYNSSTGALFYDADGNTLGGVAAIQFATLSGHPVLDHNDFLLG